MRQTMIIAAAVVGFAASAASAATLKVPEQFDTIQQAVDAAGADDVIRIRKGTYAEAVTISNKTRVTIRGKGAVIDGGATPLFIVDSSAILIDGLTLRGGATGVHCLDSGLVTIRRCKVAETTSSGMTFVDSPFAEILECTIRDAGEHGLLVLDGAARIVRNRIQRPAARGITAFASNCTIEGNTILDTLGDDGIQVGNFDDPYSLDLVADNRIEHVGSGSEHDGIHVFGADRTALVGNVIRDVADEGIEVVDSVDCLVEDNAVTDTVEDGIEGINASVNLRIYRNKVKNAGGDGIRLVPLCVAPFLFENRVRKAALDGIDSAADQAVVVGNDVKGSGELDLNVNGADLVVMGNVFDTINH